MPIISIIAGICFMAENCLENGFRRTVYTTILMEAVVDNNQ